MRNKKIKHAGFNLALQAVIIDNWRFLASICRVLAKEYGWGKERLNRWVERWNRQDFKLSAAGEYADSPTLNPA